MANKPASCKFCEQNADWAWQPFGPGESPFSFTTLGSHYRGFAVIKICNDHKIKIEWARDNNRPSIFIYGPNKYQALNPWRAIMPNGQVLTSPFDIDHLNPVLLSYDWYLR